MNESANALLAAAIKSPFRPLLSPVSARTIAVNLARTDAIGRPSKRDIEETMRVFEQLSQSGCLADRFTAQQTRDTMAARKCSLDSYLISIRGAR